MAVFKSYDIRAVYPTELNAELGRKIGVGLGRLYRSFPENAGRKPKIAVGRDMRLSAPEMAAALIDGLATAGCDVVDVGMVSTPCQYFAIQRLGADGGVMCTASHNPPQYIGYKVSREKCIPISYDTGLNLVEKSIDEPAPAGPRGTVSAANVDDDYLDFLCRQARGIKPLKVAADASNGMAGKYLEKLFAKLGVPLDGIFLEPDGRFPNHEADPLKPENLAYLQKLVPATGAAIGFCYDGDADRVAIVDETGAAIGCDLATALLAADAAKRNPGRKCTYDLRSSKVCKDAIEAAGGVAVRVRVGHSHVKKTLREIDGIVGGELSGHYYFRLEDREVFYIDSALVATVRLLNILSESGKKLSELIAPLRKYSHSGEINFAIEDKAGALKAIEDAFRDSTIDHLDGVTATYRDWWVNVRPSNTEPVLRLTLEGNTPALRDAKYAQVSALLGTFGHVAQGGH